MGQLNGQCGTSVWPVKLHARETASLVPVMLLMLSLTINFHLGVCYLSLSNTNCMVFATNTNMIFVDCCNFSIDVSNMV